MGRRLDRGMLALLPPVLAYMAFGGLRVDAPVGLIGLLFDQPLVFALLSTVVAVGGALLLFVPWIERRIAGALVPSQRPGREESDVVLWLSLPGQVLAAVFRGLRRLGHRAAGRVPALAIALHVALLLWQLLVMWLYYIGELLGAWASRGSEFAADRAAASLGYRDDLVALFRTMDDDEPASRLERLADTHPPTPARIAGLERMLSARATAV